MEDAGRLMSQHEQMFCSLDTDGGPGMGGLDQDASVASFHAATTAGGSRTFHDGDGRERFNLFGWDGQGSAPHLFPESTPS
ncbi:MAG: hypothetical protein ABI807_03045 [Sporichthyaceae bacterium]